MAVLSLVGELARKEKKSSLTYVCWACGLGKTTCMMELGHILGLVSLPPTGKKPVYVRLVLANADLVKHYEQLFAKKQEEADKRVQLEWLSMDTFKTKLEEAPAQYGKDCCLVIDEGDTMLAKEVHKQLIIAQPRHLVLISAVPAEALTGMQRFCFRTARG